MLERKRILEEKTAIKIEKIKLKNIEAQKKREEKEKEKEEIRKLKAIESQSDSYLSLAAASLILCSSSLRF